MVNIKYQIKFTYKQTNVFQVPHCNKAKWKEEIIKVLPIS